MDKAIGILIFALLSSTGLMFYGLVKEERRLMQQCMDDGKKEYECKAMLKQDIHIAQPPIVIK